MDFKIGDLVIDGTGLRGVVIENQGYTDENVIYVKLNDGIFYYTPDGKFPGSPQNGKYDIRKLTKLEQALK